MDRIRAFRRAASGRHTGKKHEQDSQDFEKRFTGLKSNTKNSPVNPENPVNPVHCSSLFSGRDGGQSPPYDKRHGLFVGRPPAAAPGKAWTGFTGFEKRLTGSRAIHKEILVILKNPVNPVYCSSLLFSRDAYRKKHEQDSQDQKQFKK